MKEIVKAIFLLAVIYLLLFFLVNTNRQSQVIQEKQPEPVILTDTIVNVEWDTVYLERYKTVKLPITDTLVYYIADTVTRVDSIFVDIPISKFQLDTTFTTDTTCLNIRIQNSGYNVKLDTLSYLFEYIPTHQKTNFFRDHFKFGAGVSTGYGFFSKQPDIFLGIGVYYTF